MPRDPSIHHRRSIRLHGYDYTAPGSYFITIDTHRRACIFGEIIGGEMQLNSFGEIAHAEWLKTAEIRHEIELDEFIVMPNHMHGIIMIYDDKTVGATRRVAPTNPNTTLAARSIGAIMAQYKSIVTKRINQSRGLPGASIWHRNYWDHIIRNEYELLQIREYIRNNPLQWELDDANADHPS